MKNPMVTIKREVAIIFMEPILSRILPAKGAAKELAIPSEMDTFI